MKYIKLSSLNSRRINKRSLLMSDADNLEVGSISWTDLTVANAREVKNFYGEVVGWKSAPVEMGGYSDFNMNTPLSGKTNCSRYMSRPRCQRRSSTAMACLHYRRGRGQKCCPLCRLGRQSDSWTQEDGELWPLLCDPGSCWCCCCTF